MNLRGWLAGLIACAVVLSATPAHAGVATDEMVACAALGAKHPGSPADHTMGDHLIDRFRGDNLQVSTEDFHMPVWKPTNTALAIADGPGKGTELDAGSFAYSGTGKVVAPVVDAGNGKPSDYDGLDVKGKIVMVDNGGAYHRTVQVQEIMARGGIGMVYVSASPRNLIQTGAVRWGQRPPASIPTVSIGHDTGYGLRDKMKQGTVTLSLDVEGQRVDAVGRNIIGMRRGTTYPDKYIVVAGHYDSWYSGANDNCSSDGTMLSMIDANKDIEPAYSMIYIGWDAEEPGLVGSYTWIAHNQDLIKNVVLNVNLEETAAAAYDGNGVKTSQPSTTLSFGSTSPTMTALATTAATGHQVLPPVAVPITAERYESGGIIATDIEGFYAQGVQGVSTASSSPYYHTTGDTMETINFDDLEKVTAYLTDFTRAAQLVPPDGFALREVPKVVVTAPKTAAPGAAVPIDITMTDPAGQPVSDDNVLVLADQNDNWAVAESNATKLGNGHYRWTLPAGSTDADMTRIRATSSTLGYLANGFTMIDQRDGGVLKRGTSCLSRRVVTLHVSGTKIRAKATRGKVTIKGHTIRLDLRKVAKGTVTIRVTARSKKTGRTLTQKRTYKTCVTG